MSQTPSNDGAGSNYKEGWTGVGKWWYASAVVVLVVVLGLVFVLLDIGGNSDDDQPPSGTPSGAPTPAVPSGGTQSTNPDLAPGGFVDLPAPIKSTEGYPTHYPQTPEGAAATSAAAALATTSIDYDEMATVLGLYITGIELDQSTADVLVSKLRETMRLSLSGPPPAGAGITSEITGIKWRVVDDTRVVVNYQERYTFTVPGRPDQVSGVAGVATMVWIDDRWWADGTVPDTDDEVYSEQGSAQFASDGYNVIRNLDWAGGLQ